MESIGHPRIYLRGDEVRIQEPDGVGDAILWEGIVPRGDNAALAACLVAIPAEYGGHALEAIQARDRGPRPIPGGAYIQSLADVEPEEVRWLWRARIPRGKITVLAGDPGEGKTWAAIDIGAHVTRGDPLPGDEDDGQDREPEAVVYLSAEDGPADTLRPRFDAAEADVRRVTLVHHVAATEQVGRGDEAEIVDIERGLLLTDTAALTGILEHVHPGLVVVDPVQGYFGPDADTRRANVVRQVMADLARLADEHGCAVLVLMHLKKAEGQRTIYRILDSIDFGAAARSVMLLGVHPDDRDRADTDKRRVLLTVKHNLAPRPVELGFTLDGRRVTWTGPTDVTEADLLGAGRGRRGQAGDALATAKTWLLEALASGPLASEEVLSRGKEAGHAERTPKRAKAELFIGAERQSAEDGRRGDGGWV